MDTPACEYCKIIFLASDSVFASHCGHLFHEACLFKRSAQHFQSCPHCIPSDSLRVFLPFQRDPSAKESLVTKCQTMKHDLVEVEKDLVNVRAAQTNLEKSVKYGAIVIDQKNKKVSELKVLIKEKENLQKKLRDCEKLYAVQKALAGTSIDVDNILKQKPPPDTLATMAVSLKREINLVKAAKKEIRSEMRVHQKENEVLASNYRNRREKFEIAVARSIKKGAKN